MALSTCFDPLAFPFVRAKTYVDPNPPAVLADEFFNPTQDALARFYGAAVGYSTSLVNDEFVLPHAFGTPPAAGDQFGQELAVYTNQGGNFDFGTVSAAVAGMHGVYEINGTVNGNRGAGTGFGVADAARNVGQMRWLFRQRLRVNKYSHLATNGLVLGIGTLSSNNPVWIADSSGDWQNYTQDGANAAAFPTVDDQWITLWIGCKDADLRIRFYYMRDGVDALPVLADTYLLTAPHGTFSSIERTFRYLVNNTAMATDYVQVDNIGMICER